MEKVREIKASKIVAVVKDMCIKGCHELPEDVIKAIKRFRDQEISPQGKEVLDQLLENAQIAKEEMIPICQDTGAAVFFVELGTDVRIVDGDLNSAISEGVSSGYTEGYLRKSMVRDPFDRVNTQDNTPPIIHLEMVKGDKLKISFLAKGGGSENMAQLAMLKPSDGLEGVKKFIIKVVKDAGANPCPPIIVGIGIGGTFEKTALLAKKSLLRPLGIPNPDPKLDKLEKELEEELNKLGIGPAGFGGRTTVLGVRILTYPCHITALPVVVNIQCHASRHEEVIL